MKIKKILTYAGIVLALLILAYAFVPQVLTGKIVNQSDISGWRGMVQETARWNAAHPDDPAAADLHPEAARGAERLELLRLRVRGAERREERRGGFDVAVDAL